MVKLNDEILTLKEVAELLKISPNYVYQIWPSWRDKGVKVLKAAANSAPRFYKSEILKMMEIPK
jgi:DNA-directed RNA polymerase specialized sigma subunit